MNIDSVNERNEDDVPAMDGEVNEKSVKFGEEGFNCLKIKKQKNKVCAFFVFKEEMKSRCMWWCH